ncbi:MFS transporter [Sphingobium amiense]|uniref:MFS transporter n=1 Tax=Sphingobium amiense TaxID=135719 RepID=A0A494WC83_9SPHN|nr:MFS transporter [Sphingobium amiense]BBD98390.1 MFS transporter [Sphingobium amiense]
MIDQKSRYYPWLLLAVLWITYLLSSLDRIVINLLVEPIKADFGLSDTQISLLQGPAFITAFSVAIIPMGILVDRVNRTRLLGAALGLWSVMTGLCGLASSFWTLFAARAGVGLGEAALNPAGYSLISDAFKKDRLGLALGIFVMGGAVGAGLAFILGGVVIGALSRHGDIVVPLLGTLRPWQLTFVILAVPGLIMALILSTLPNPLRKTSATAAGRPGESMIKGFYRQNWPLLARHHVAMGSANTVQLGMLAWIAPLLTRVHGWDSATIGMVVGSVMLVALPIGLIGGGYIGDALMRFGAHMRLVVCAASIVCAAMFGIFYPLQSDPWHLVIVFGVASLFAGIPPGVGNAALHHVVPGEIRGRVSAIYYLIVLVLGMAGPTLVALASDNLFPFATGIRYATIMVIPPMMLFSALMYLWAIPPYRRLANEVESEQKSSDLKVRAV